MLGRSAFVRVGVGILRSGPGLQVPQPLETAPYRSFYPPVRVAPEFRPQSLLAPLRSRSCGEAGIDEPLDLVLVDLVGAASQAADAPKLSSSGLRESEAND